REPSGRRVARAAGDARLERCRERRELRGAGREQLVPGAALDGEPDRERVAGDALGVARPTSVVARPRRELGRRVRAILRLPPLHASAGFRATTSAAASAASAATTAATATDRLT